MKHNIDYVFKEEFHGVGIHGLLHWYENKKFKPWYTAYIEIPTDKAKKLETKVEFYNMPVSCNNFGSDVIFFDNDDLGHVEKYNKNYALLGIDSDHSMTTDFLDQISGGPEELKKDIKRLALVVDILLRHFYDYENGLFTEESVYEGLF